METQGFLSDAGAVARDRLNKYLAEKLAKSSDVTVWEFYTFLLKQAQKREPDTSYKKIYSSAYKEDRAISDQSWEDYKNKNFRSLQSDNSPRGEQT